MRQAIVYILSHNTSSIMPTSTSLLTTAYYRHHGQLLLDSYQRLTGQPLLTDMDETPAIEQLNQASFGLVSHGTESDPVFNFANQKALTLFDYSWEAFTALPSRFSAELISQAERDALLAQVTQHGFIDNYTGVRISRTGQRFLIKHATVWNITDDNGIYHGQAAKIDQWEML